MKKRTIPIISVLVLLILILGFRLAQGKSMAGTIVLENADASNYFSMTASSSLNTLVNQVASRIKVAMANTLKYHPVAAPPGEFSSKFNAVASRMKIEFANGVRYNTIAYPKTLINDTTKPSVVQTASSSTYLGIYTSEHTTMVIQYGFAPGSYSNQVNDPLYASIHYILLSKFPAGQKVYYRVTLVDRSGNQSTSGELVMTPPTKIFLPHIKK